MQCIKWVALSIMISMAHFSFGVNQKLEAAEWFEANERELTTIVERLKAHGNIRRVERMRVEVVAKYGKFTDEDAVVYTEILGSLKAMDVEAVVVNRSGGVKSGNLISIDFILDRSGFVFTGGHSLTVEYIVEKSIIENAKQRNKTYYALPVRGWYVAEYVSEDET